MFGKRSDYRGKIEVFLRIWSFAFMDVPEKSRNLLLNGNVLLWCSYGWLYKILECNVIAPVKISVKK